MELPYDIVIIALEVDIKVKRFYYIALKEGKSCEGICRSASIDTARRELRQKGMEEINLALLRSDTVDFLDLDNPAGESVSS